MENENGKSLKGFNFCIILVKMTIEVSIDSNQHRERVF